jgi:hypothetical protein
MKGALGFTSISGVHVLDLSRGGCINATELNAFGDFQSTGSSLRYWLQAK